MEKIEETYKIINGVLKVRSWDGQYVHYVSGEEDILLEGTFTIEELRYFIEVMQMKNC